MVPEAVPVKGAGDDRGGLRVAVLEGVVVEAGCVLVAVVGGFGAVLEGLDCLSVTMRGNVGAGVYAVWIDAAVLRLGSVGIVESAGTPGEVDASMSRGAPEGRMSGMGCVLMDTMGRVGAVV